MAKCMRITILISAALIALGIAAYAQNMNQLSADITSLIKDAVPSVVSVKVERNLMGEWNSGKTPMRGKNFLVRATGTGFIIDSAGYVLTSNTVTANARDITIAFPDGTSFKGKLAGSDPFTNTALVKIDKQGLKALDMGDSTTLKPGALVVLVNNRNGEANAVTLGIISSTEAHMADIVTPILQITGNIGPGASGGPVFDSSGKVVGMTIAMSAGPLNESHLLEQQKNANETHKMPAEITADSLSIKKGENGQKRFVVGYTWRGGPLISGNTSYAVPINTVKGILDSLKSGKEVEYGYLGLLISDKDNKIEVREVESGSPAGKAGIKQGDTIISANGKAYKSRDEFISYISSLRPGESIKLRVNRGGTEIELTATVGKRLLPKMPMDISSQMKQLEDINGNFKNKPFPALPDLAMPSTSWNSSPFRVFSINLDNADIKQIGKALSEAYNTNIIVTDPAKITRKVSIHLSPKTITLDRALSAICHTLSCRYHKDGDTYVISPK